MLMNFISSRNKSFAAGCSNRFQFIKNLLHFRSPNSKYDQEKHIFDVVYVYLIDLGTVAAY